MGGGGREEEGREGQGEVGGTARALTFTFSLPPSVSPPPCPYTHARPPPPLSCSTAATLLVIAIKHVFWVAASKPGGPLLEDAARPEDSAGEKSSAGDGVGKKRREGERESGTLSDKEAEKCAAGTAACKRQQHRRIITTTTAEVHKHGL